MKNTTISLDPAKIAKAIADRNRVLGLLGYAMEDESEYNISAEPVVIKSTSIEEDGPVSMGTGWNESLWCYEEDKNWGRK